VDAPTKSYVVMRMAKLLRSLSIVLLTLLVASANVEAQSGVSSSDETSSLPVHQASQFGMASKAKATEARRAGNASVLARRASQLCFLPGIGWQRIPIATKDTTGVTGTQSSHLKGEEQSPYVGIVRLAYKYPSGMGLNSNAPCTGAFSSVTAPEVLKEDYGKAAASHNPVGINSGSQEPLYRNPLVNDSLINVIGNGIRWPGAMDTTSTGTVLGRPSELRGRAHTSPIELRREIRNAPDLMTRIKLRRLQNELEHKSRSLTANATARHIPKRNLNGLFGRRDSSSLLYGVRDHANGQTRFPFKHAN